MQADLILKTNAILGEGALWDIEAKRLLWVDITGGEIHAFHPATGMDELLLKSDQMIGTVVQREHGGLAVAERNGFAFVDEAAGRLEPICDPEPDKPQNRFNDGKCDPAGRFWAGTMSICHERSAGSLYRLDTDLKCSRMESGISISNGIAWSPDGSTMYYTDTPVRAIWAYDYDIESGGIANRRTVVEITPGEGGPDGFTVDAEGMLWVAQWGGWRVCRYNPRTGRKLMTVEVPAAHVSSCALGGDNLDELYITTAREGLTGAEFRDQPLAGSLFAAKVGVKGLQAYKFKG